MSQRLDLQRIERNAYRDSVRDGLMEIVLGLFLLLLAPGLLSSRAYLVMPLVLFTVFFAPRLIDRLRRRLTYPRIGYVELLPEDPRRLGLGMLAFFLAGIAVVIVALLVTGTLADARSWYRWAPLLFAVASSGGFLSVAFRSAYIRYYLFTGLSLASGLAFSLMHFPGRLEGLGLQLLTLGAVLLLWGAAVLVRFLRSNPVLPEGTDNGRE